MSEGDAPATTLEKHVTCRGCLFDLYGSAEDGACPECGLAVAESLKSDRLHAADPAWLRRVAGGLRLSVWAMLGVVMLGVALIAYTVWYESSYSFYNYNASARRLHTILVNTGLLGMLVCGYLAMLGGWRALALEPRPADDIAMWRDPPARRWGRIGLGVSGVCLWYQFAMIYANDAPRDRDEPWLWVMLLIVHVGTTLVLIRPDARREVRLAYRVTMGLCFVIGFATGIENWVEADAWFAVGLWVLGVITLTACVLGVTANKQAWQTRWHRRTLWVAATGAGLIGLSLGLGEIDVDDDTMLFWFAVSGLAYTGLTVAGVAACWYGRWLCQRIPAKRLRTFTTCVAILVAAAGGTGLLLYVMMVGPELLGTGWSRPWRVMMWLGYLSMLLNVLTCVAAIVIASLYARRFRRLARSGA